MTDDDSLSLEDKALFREVMRTVQPLKQSVRRHVPQPTPKIKVQKKIQEFHTETSFQSLSDHLSEVVESETILSYSKPGFPKKRFQALQSGSISWQAYLDLHGVNSEQITSLLIGFIRKNFFQGIRCVLIIHGKGGYQGRPPVLKNKINAYLPQFNEVLAFHSAQGKDGGCGAVYVLLGRSSKSCKK